jgi:hypothetical protein
VSRQLSPQGGRNKCCFQTYDSETRSENVSLPIDRKTFRMPENSFEFGLCGRIQGQTIN